MEERVEGEDDERERSWRRWRGYKGQGGVRYGEEEVREEEAAVAAAAFSRRQHSLLMLTGSTLFLACHTTGRCSTSIKQHYGHTSLEPKQSSTLTISKAQEQSLVVICLGSKAYYFSHGTKKTSAALIFWKKPIWSTGRKETQLMFCSSN